MTSVCFITRIPICPSLSFSIRFHAAMKTIRTFLLTALAAILTLFTAAPRAQAAPGDVDSLDAPVIGTYIAASAVQPDGKTIIAGDFTSVLGQPRNHIARLNADGTLDAGFNPNVNGFVFSVAVQADGRILLGGFFTSVGGTGRNCIARVDAAGVLDAGFNPNPNYIVNSVAVQADGRILLGGRFTEVGGTTRNRIARVDAAGTLDAGFNPNAGGEVHSVALQADGRILLGGAFSTVGGIPRNRIARVDSAGTLDAGFNPNAGGDVRSVAVQADGRILLGGIFTIVNWTTRNGIARVDAAGTLDAGFNPNVEPHRTVNSVAVQADGRILLGGEFTSVGGTVRNGIARVDAAGVLDAGFNPNANNAVFSVAVQADGRILLGGLFTSVGGTVRNRFARLLNDAATQTLSAPDATQITWTRGGSSPEVSQVTFEQSTDGGATWTPLGSGTRIGTTPNWQLTGLSLSGSGQLRARGRTTGGYSSGSSGVVQQVEAFFLSAVDSLDAAVGGSHVLASAVQPDGKTIIAGAFTSVLGQPRNNIARLNADGTLDAVFNPNVNGPWGGEVFCVAVQADGRILLGGQFTSVGGTPCRNIARLNADGTFDAGFNLIADSQVRCLAVQADGRILFGGDFSFAGGGDPNNFVGGIARYGIARVDAAGALDMGFNSNLDNGQVYSVAVQTDGRILLGGTFTSVNGTVRNRIARVDAAGTLDAGFNPDANGGVNCVAVQADGRILIGSGFSTLGGTIRWVMARVDAAGTLDAGFNPDLNNEVRSVAVQADGRILLGGSFTTVGGTVRNRIARVNAAGTLDAGFNPNANNAVFSVAVQADGRILLGGLFTSVGGTVRNRFARLLNDAATQTLSVPDATQLTWTRGGSSPEVSQVTFEKSTDSGATWTPLGIGTRIGITPNWQLTGLALTGTGQVRARGRTTGGQSNGSSGLIEQLTAFTFFTPLQQWKLTHLGDAAAPNDGDTDFDGLRTILEYATGGDPLVAGALPAVSTVAGRLAITFSRNTAATDVTLTVQGSDDLSTWTDLARSTAGATMVPLVAGANVAETGAGALRTLEVRDLFLTTDPAHPRRFLRLHAAP